jgi:glycerol transport system permease protein
MSLKTNTEITSTFTLFPQDPTFAQLRTILTDPSWYMGYINSMIYVVMNTVISITRGAAGGLCLLALPLPGRQAPVLLAADQPHGAARGVRAAVLPALFRGSACSTPISPWRWRIACSTCRWRSGSSKASCRGVPKEIDETAYIDGYSFPRFFVKIFMPLIASGIGVAAFFCFMFSWVELLLSRTLTTTVDAKPIAATMTRTVSASGMDWGVLAAAGVLTIVPGASVIYFVRNYIAKGFALGRV